MRNDPEALPPGRLKIDRLGTGRGRSGSQPEEDPPGRGQQPALRRKQGRRGESPPKTEE
jgi:hypothetical protein